MCFFLSSAGRLCLAYHTGARWTYETLPCQPALIGRGQFAAVYSPLRNHTEAFYRGSNGFLGFCYKTSEGWVNDTSSFKAAGRVLGSISAVYSPLRSHSEVYFRGEDGNVNLFYWKDGAWVHDQVLQGFASQSVDYQVVTGDTMSSIAARFGLSLQELLAANPQVTNPDLIYTDQAITVPPTY